MASSYPPYNSVSHLNEKRLQAQRMRAEFLLAVGDGLMSVWEFIQASKTVEGIPLREVRLRKLLESQPGWGPTRATNVIRQMGDLMEMPGGNKGPKIGWIIDARTGGNRFRVMNDVISRLDSHGRGVLHTPPWDGFPYVPIRPSIQ